MEPIDGYRKKYFDMLFTYCGFFEEMFDNGYDMESDNEKDYIKAIEALREAGLIKGFNTYVDQILNKDLPFEKLKK